MIKYSSDLLFLHGSALRLYINDRMSSELFGPHADVVEIIFDIQLNDATDIVSKRQAMDLGLAVCHRVLCYLSGEHISRLRLLCRIAP